MPMPRQGERAWGSSVCVSPATSALGLAVDPAVLVPVMSQPSMPFAVSKKHRSDLHVAPDDLVTIKKRTVDEELCVIGLRFTADPLVPSERFERLRQEFGDAFIGVEIDSSKDKPLRLRENGHTRCSPPNTNPIQIIRRTKRWSSCSTTSARNCCHEH